MATVVTHQGEGGGDVEAEDQAEGGLLNGSVAQSAQDGVEVAALDGNGIHLDAVGNLVFSVDQSGLLDVEDVAFGGLHLDRLASGELHGPKCDGHVDCSVGGLKEQVQL